MADLTVPVHQDDHVQGLATAPVTLVEYGDYECPYCADAYPVVKVIQQQLGSSLRFVFRHFPRSDVHHHARHAAEAAEGAAAQGKFWEMDETLFEHQRALEDAGLEHYAAQLGLAMDKFKQDMAHHIYAQRIYEDIESGTRSGVRGTPPSLSMACFMKIPILWRCYCLLLRRHLAHKNSKNEAKPNIEEARELQDMSVALPSLREPMPVLESGRHR